ncbi:hypothetical protein [Streptomyces sp. NPDC020983]|uniref:hypothetical protein n=1 Tax=Streptomyces sp. NPDC020983 TaxID=3365106 RepID=UPI003798FC65
MGDDAGAGEPQSGYEVRSSWGWRTVARTAVVAGIVAVVTLNPTDWHVTTGSVVRGCYFLGWGMFFVGQQYELHRRGCLLRIDEAGLTVAGEPTVPWRELRKAEVRRGGLVFFPWSPATELPLLPVGPRVLSGGARRRRKRLMKQFGTALVVPTRLYGVRRAEVVAAVRHYSGTVPVFE